MVLVKVTSRGWDLPGGHLEGDETPLEALVRELQEEAGLAITPASASVFGMFLVTRTSESTPSSQMEVYRVDLPADPELSVSGPSEINQAACFALDDLPPETSTLIWYPYVALLGVP